MPRLAKALRRGLALPVRCSEARTVRVTLTVSGRDAKRAGLVRRAAGRVRVGAASAGRAGRVTVRFGKRARRALARLRRMRVAYTVTATDAAGNRSRVLTGTVTLRRRG